MTICTSWHSIGGIWTGIPADTGNCPPAGFDHNATGRQHTVSLPPLDPDREPVLGPAMNPDRTACVGPPGTQAGLSRCLPNQLGRLLTLTMLSGCGRARPRIF